MTNDPLYIQFVYYFNVERDYYECHEVMEELWLEEGRDPLCQGLLQIAVGLFHARNDNVGGAIKLFTQGLAKLRPHEHTDLGIDLRRLIADSEQYVSRLESNTETPFPYEDLTLVITSDQLARQVDDYAQRMKNRPHEE